VGSLPRTESAGIVPLSPRLMTPSASQGYNWPRRLQKEPAPAVLSRSVQRLFSPLKVTGMFGRRSRAPRAYVPWAHSSNRRFRGLRRQAPRSYSPAYSAWPPTRPRSRFLIIINPWPGKRQGVPSPTRDKVDPEKHQGKRPSVKATRKNH